MATSRQDDAESRDPGTGEQPSRINVAVSRPMLAAIDRIIERERVTLTEAVRRLIGYGDFVYGVARQEGATLVVRDGGGRECEVRVT